MVARVMRTGETMLFGTGCYEGTERRRRVGQKSHHIGNPAAPLLNKVEQFLPTRNRSVRGLTPTG
jgi:hypothetical protein